MGWGVGHSGALSPPTTATAASPLPSPPSPRPSAPRRGGERQRGTWHLPGRPPPDSLMELMRPGKGGDTA